jgi:glycosyltransferase involved in cell wall biosynthesis
LKNSLLFTDSHHSKYSLASFFPDLPLNTIQVIYPPLKEKTQPAPGDDESRLLSQFDGMAGKDYFLIISANRWIKNAWRAIHALDGLFSRNVLEQRVVVLGVTDTNSFGIKNRDKFVMRPYVSHEELEMLYRNAFALIFPSLNEGFGYPPLEAMKYGTPVLASAISSIPEICADAALYFNPCSIDEMQKRILRLCDNPQLYDELAKKGSARFDSLKKAEDEAIHRQLEIIFRGNIP